MGPPKNKFRGTKKRGKQEERERDSEAEIDIWSEKVRLRTKVETTG